LSLADVARRVLVRLVPGMDALARERDAASERQAATAEVLSIIAASPGQLKPVFDTILDHALRLCEAANGMLFRVEGDLLRVAAHRGIAPALAAHMEAGPLRPGPKTPAMEMRRTGATVHVADLRESPSYRERDPVVVGVVEIGGVRTVAFVPMLREGKVVGAINVHRREVRPFTDQQLALLDHFAQQAVIAIENARLLAELLQRTDDLQESLDYQTAISDVLKVISRSAFDLDTVLQTALGAAVRLCRATYGVIFRNEGGEYRMVAGHRLTPEYEVVEREVRIRPGTDTIVGRAALEGRTVQIEDAWTDPAYADKDHARRGDARTMLGVPLLREDAVVGVIGLARATVEPFSEREVQLVTTFADQAVIAIENARLIGELRHRTDDLQESLDYQTAISDVLKVISRSAVDLDAVLHTVVTSAVRLCHADSAGIYRNHDGEYRWVMGHATLPDYEKIELDVRIRPGRGTLVGRAALEGRTVQIDDAWTDPDYEAKEDARVGGIHSLLGVPLMREGTVIGVIGLGRNRIEPYNEREVQLVTTFADQAVIAIENARLFDELRRRTDDLAESLKQQTATADVLKVISRSAFDLQHVFETVAENALRLCEADKAFIFRFDGELLRAAVAYNASDELRQFVDQNPIRPGRHSGTARCALERRTVHIADVTTDPEYTYGAKSVDAIRTVLCAPMLKGDALLGVILVYHLEVRPFTENQIALVETFADQAAIAIENVRLFDELRRRTDDLAQSVEELKALGEVTQAVNSTLDLQTVLSTIVAKAVEISATDAGAIYVFDEARDAFTLSATFGMDEATIAAIRAQRVALGDPGIAEAAQRSTPVQIADLAAASRSAVTDIVLKAGFRALLVMPLLRSDRIVGLLVVRRRAPGAFPAAIVALLETFAAQSVIALQNARLFAEIEEKGRELAIASQHKSQFLANMSHELRTPLNAILGYTELILDDIYGATPPKMREVLARVQTNGKHLLGLINDVLDLSKIEAGQLVLSLADYSVSDLVQGVYSAVEPLATEKRLALTLDLAPDLPPGRGDERRISQVLLNLVGNAIKFTDAGEVAISAAAANGTFTLAVRDTGPGIPADAQTKIFEEFQQADQSITRTKGGTGLGLAISKRIVEMHGGRLWVESHVGLGSTFRFTLPVTVERASETAA
jgi:GAF domain-containing protein